MTFLVTQIIFCLLLAFLLGGLFGWLLRHSSAKKREAFLEEDLRVATARFNDADSELKRSKIQLDETNVELARSSKQNLGLQKDVTAYSSEVHDKQGDITALKSKLGGFEKRVTQLAQQSTEWQSKEAELEAKLKAARENAATERSQLQKNLAAEKDSLNKDLAAKDEAIKAVEENQLLLQRQSIEHKQAAESKQKELGSLQLLLTSQTSKTESALQARTNVEQSMDRERAKQSELRTEIRELQGRLAKARADIDNGEAQHARHKDKLAKQYVALEELRDELRKCQAAREGGKKPAVSTATVKPVVAKPAPAASASVKVVASNKDASIDARATEAKLHKTRPTLVDDLKKIKGVGPKLEGILNGLGIYQFAQIAQFNSRDLAWIDDNISAFKGRAERDNWVAQAKKLAG